MTPTLGNKTNTDSRELKQNSITDWINNAKLFYIYKGKYVWSLMELASRLLSSSVGKFSTIEKKTCRLQKLSFSTFWRNKVYFFHLFLQCIYFVDQTNKSQNTCAMNFTRLNWLYFSLWTYLFKLLYESYRHVWIPILLHFDIDTSIYFILRDI